MNYNEELKQKVMELAALPDYTPGKIARILGIDASEMEAGELRDSYDAGKLKAAGEFSKKVVQLSNQGSGPAQSLLKKMMQDNEVNTLREIYG